MRFRNRQALLTLAAACLATTAIAADESQGVIKLRSQVQQQCGINLGGVGAGFIDLWPDGGLHDWQIFNRGRWGYRGDDWDTNKQDRPPLTDIDQNSLQFFVTSRSTDGKMVARRLSTIGDQLNVYSYNTWLQPVEGIRYEATFPGATLKYEDPTLPVEVTGRFFSPITPHDLRTSATPGFYATFTLHNPSDREQEVSLVSYLENPIGRGGDAAHRGAAVRQLQNTVKTENGVTALTMRTDADLPFKTTTGSVCLSMAGGEPSWIASDFGEYLNGRTISVTPWNQRYETPWREFRKTGRLPSIDATACPTQLGALKVGGAALPNTRDLPKVQAAANQAEIDKLSDDEIGKIIEQAKTVASLKSILQQAEAVKPDLLVPAKAGRELVGILRQTVAQYAGENGKAVNWGDGMLANRVTLKPGETKEIRVVFSWYFPNHPAPKADRNMGHMYSKWFKDAADVNAFMSANYDSINGRVSAFQHAFDESTLPSELLAAVSTQLNTLICGSWWTAEDQMGMWEGFGTIGQNTVDVAYQGSHPITSLFPEWEKKWTGLATTYQAADSGRLYHSLPGDMTKGPKKNGYGYIDVNCHFALMMTRDYLWFGDKTYLDTYYPAMVKAITAFDPLDTDDDGLPDDHTASNTYDTWEMRGTQSYLSSLRVNALRGGIRMAEDVGDTEHATKWKATLEKALANFDKKLWNGEYYTLWYDGKTRDEACMTDQLSGEMYARLIGLGNALPEARVKAALAAVYKYNFDPEHGLFNGTYPPGRQPHMPTFQNVQGEGNWTGIEYAAAAAMIDQGMVDQGMDIVKAVGQRYARGGRYFNHEECGPHYYRPMSIWATFLAASGFKVDAPRQMITIASPVKSADVKSPWVSATGLGRYTRTASTFELRCDDGQATFKTLRLNVPGVKEAVINGKAVKCGIAHQDGLTALEFDQPVTLAAGQVLIVR